jgi:hypothetical protein
MTESSEFELLELATPYALDAVSENERAASKPISRRPPPLLPDPSTTRFASCGNNGRRLGLDTGRTAGGSTRAAAGIRQVRLGTLIRLAHSSLRGSSRDCHRARRAERRIGVTLHSATIDPGAGVCRGRCAHGIRRDACGRHRDFVYSREKNAGVLVMNNVPPPSSGPCIKCG